ncbi:MAG: hypothetical protein ACK5NE_09070 [Brachymonas sp.]
MGLLKTIVEQLQAQSGVTAVTTEKTTLVTAKPNTGAGCTGVTAITAQNRYTGEAIMQLPQPAANDPAMADWKTLDRAYLAHHAQCPQCIAAGKGYGQRCGTGAALWRQYDACPIPARKSSRPAAMPADLAALLDAAMLACNFWGDGLEAREAMRQHCLTVPTHQRRELAAYFHDLYGRHNHD